MRTTRQYIGSVIWGALLTCAAVAQAQTIAIAPGGYITAGPGGKQQFTATVTGSASTAVTWSINGVGSMNATGLYTAPSSIPATGSVQIDAKLTSNSKITASTYLYLLTSGPVLTSVTPNPLPQGTVNLTIHGTGFQSDATILLDGAQLVTSSVTPTAVTATGYLPSEASAVISVRNPTSVSSNSLTVPVAQPTYSLNVVGGTGSGSYAAGKVVAIVAGAAPAGQFFQSWTGAAVQNATAASTTLTMPAAGTTVTANYGVKTYALTVANGTGSGSYAAGSVVQIAANAPPSGKIFSAWTGATVASPASPSTTMVMPAAAASVTANYVTSTVQQYSLTVVNGTGSGTYTPGASVAIAANAAPSGQIFTGWTGATVANSGAASTSLTMPSAATIVTANYTVTSTGTIPYPVTTHPRLWITQSDLPRLQSWANASNAVYQQGMKQVLATAVANYQQFAPFYGSNPPAASSYPDPGDSQGYTGLITEENAVILAFNSLIDPNPANQILYAQMARNLIMYAMNQAAQGIAPGLPFRDGSFGIYNRASETGQDWPLAIDWIYNKTDASNTPILSASDKLTIRDVFLIWAGECLTASTTGGDNPSTNPPGIVNNAAALLPNGQPYRMAANNYYAAHARMLTMMALTIDPANDPVLNAAQSPATLGNTLRSYIGDATGAWLYQQYAMYGEPSAIAAAYGVSAQGFGLASGGLPPEGMLYGVSFGNILGGLLALQTAGFNNPSYAGPQIAMINTPMWSRYVKGMISSLTPAPLNPTGSESYLGQIYQFASYGDLLRLFATPDYIKPFGLLSLLEQENGQSTDVSAARWFGYNVLQGGPSAFNTRVTDSAYGWIDSILYYMLYDPAVNPASLPDPRPTYSTNFVDAGGGRIVAHTDWTTGGTMFDYRASWESINHQDGNAGQFELFRNGEWLTKEFSNYDNNGLGLTTYYHNTLGLQNACAGCADPKLIVGDWEQGELANGSQWMLGESAGDPVTLTSSGKGYAFAATDMTNLYNRPNQWTPANAFVNVTQATRSIIWLNGDYVVVYDRASTLNSGLFKRWNLTLVTNPVIAGHTATETLASGQQLFVQSLLPANGSLTARYAAGDLTTIAETEPSQYVMTVQDTSNPGNTRFLHVLQGANAGAAMVPATHLQSTSGTSFDGAVFGANAVWFPVNTGAFSGTTLNTPAGVHTVFVTGLVPNASYSVSVQAAGTGNTIVIAAGGSGTTTDAAGVMQLSF